MAAHRLHDSAQTKQIKIRERPEYNLKWILDLKEASFPVNCSVLSRSATDWARPEASTSCVTSRLTRGAHTSFYQSSESRWSNVLHSMVGKSLMGWDFATQQEGKVRFSHTDWLHKTHSEYGCSISLGTTFPQGWREASSCSSQGRRPSCYCMTYICIDLI